MMKGKKYVIPVLPVSDLERSREFYEGKLGLKVEEKGPDGLVLSTGDSLLYIYETTASRGEATALSISVEDFDSEIKELREKGIKFEEYDLPNLKTREGVAEMEGIRSAWFKDPDGNVLSLGEWKALEKRLFKAA
ncbi:MAG: VOC family protein [Thermoleophilia bacterium]